MAVRQMALSVKVNGAQNNNVFADLRAQRLHPSIATTNQWAHRLATEGTVRDEWEQSSQNSPWQPSPYA
jgi:hypothetical protein